MSHHAQQSIVFDSEGLVHDAHYYIAQGYKVVFVVYLR